MTRRIVRWLAVAICLAFAAGYAVINLAPDDPKRWHVDPATIALRGTPNEYLAATPGTTAAVPQRLLPIYREEPQALIARFDAMARAEPRTTVLAGDVKSLMITYVQRSRVVGFPDYVTVKAVPAEGGAGLIVWSRSRYGRGDFGVNRARVESWLEALEAGS